MRSHIHVTEPVALFLTMLTATPALSQAYRIERVASGLNQPTYVTQAPNDPVTTDAVVSTGPPGPPDIIVGRGGDPFGPPGAPNGAPRMTFAPPDPPPVARKPDPVRIGGQIRAPQRIVYVAPEYPMMARRAGIQESVTLEATIDEHGIVRNVRAVKPSPLFEKAAIDAVSQWRYEPTRLNGQAVPVILTVTVSFEIKK